MKILQFLNRVKRKNNLVPTLSFLIIFFGCKDKSEIPCLNCPTSFNVIDSDPAWSPDGLWIAYCHSDSEFKLSGIYLINPDGSENKLWQQGSSENPVWSPDGQWIAFSENGQIWKKKFNGDSLINLTSGGRHFFPAWGANGALIAYNQTVCDNLPCGLWLLNLKDMSNNFVVPYAMYPNFHPFNKEIIYVKRWVENNGNVLGDSVFTFNYGSGAKNLIIALKDPNYDNRYFRYNNSGTRVLFVSQSLDGSGFTSLWAMDSDGKNRKLLISKSYDADWNPDGNQIVYTDELKGRLWILDSNNQNNTQLTFKYQFNH